jgi:hypothetical protein
MELCPRFGRFVRRFVGLTIFGAMVLLFAGPILALLIPMTACAAIGFLVWLPVHTLVFGHRGAWRRVHERGRRCRELLQSRARAVQCRCKAAAHIINNIVERWLQGMRQFLLEMTCGALVGILVALATDAGEPEVALAALLGAAAGTAIVLSRWRGSVEQSPKA